MSAARRRGRGAITGAQPRAAFAWAYSLFGFGYVVTATFLVAIVRANPEMRPVEPWVWVVVGLTAAPSVALWVWLGARLGIARTFAVACLIEAVDVATSVLWPTSGGALLAAVLLGGTVMGITALGLVGGRRLAAGDPRRALGPQEGEGRVELRALGVKIASVEAVISVGTLRVLTFSRE